MDFVFMVVIILSVYGMRIKCSGEWCETYLSREQTAAVNGIFVMLVFLRHFSQYIQCGNYDPAFWLINEYLQQLLVTTFLFYSGYGIMVSLKNKKGYSSRLPGRIRKVWVQFACAVLLFLLFAVITGNSYGVVRILLSFTGWDSIGNSNWYIFAILVCYLLTFLGCKLSGDNPLKTTVIVLLGCGLYIAVLQFAGKGSWYYDTIFCYPVGMLYGHYKQPIEAFLWKNVRRYLCVLAGAAICFVGAYICSSVCSDIVALVALELRSVFFVLLVVLVTMKLEIGNPVLNWLGSYTFELYILQRLPMMAFKGVVSSRYVYFLLSLLITLLLAVLFKKVEKAVSTAKRKAA